MALTRDQIVDRILKRIARGGETELQADVVAEINIAQAYTLERGYPKPWFLLDIATVQVDATGFKAPTPTGFIELLEEGYSVLMEAADGSSLLPLEVTDRASVESSYESVNTETTVSLMEGYFLLGTALPENTNIRVLYYKAEPLNETAYGAGSQPAANRWITYAADLLIAKVSLIMAGTYIRDTKVLDMLDALHTQAMRRIVAENAGRKEAARERFLNGAIYPIPDAPRTVTATT